MINTYKLLNKELVQEIQALKSKINLLENEIIALHQQYFEEKEKSNYSECRKTTNQENRRSSFNNKSINKYETIVESFDLLSVASSVSSASPIRTDSEPEISTNQVTESENGSSTIADVALNCLSSTTVTDSPTAATDIRTDSESEINTNQDIEKENRPSTMSDFALNCLHSTCITGSPTAVTNSRTSAGDSQNDMISSRRSTRKLSQICYTEPPLNTKLRNDGPDIKKTNKKSYKKRK